MARLISIDSGELSQISAQKGQLEKYCQELEAGNILFFPTCPFEFPKAELDFLRNQKQSSASNRKNIAYKPLSDKISNFESSSPEQAQQLLDSMRNYSRRSIDFLSELLPPYAKKWRLDYASFRPFQEQGRQLRVRARNDLLHVDAFPTRPMHGGRILRFFTNINPQEGRRWITTQSFEQLAQQFGGEKGVPFPRGVSDSFPSLWARKLKKTARQMGLPVVLRSPYDVFMLNLHNFLKENGEFQKNCPKDHWEFPPLSCWAVYTDLVSHAAISGQYALEQTLIVPPSALVDPQKAPVSVLEKLSGRRMIDPVYA